MSKSELLKPRVLDCIDRLRKVIELNGPPAFIGECAFSVFSVVLAAYGEEAGRGLIRHIREQDLQERAVCSWGDCINTVERPPLGICPDCEREIGCDPDSMAKIDEEAEKLCAQWEAECDGCDGTGLMEGWNRRDGNSCPKCKGTGLEPKSRQT